MSALPGTGVARLDGVVLVSGVFELAPLMGTSIDAALKLDAPEVQQCSPARQPLAGFVHSIVCWGEIETAAFKSQSHAFAERLRAAGTPCAEFEVPAKNHFDVVLDLAAAGTLLGRHTLALLEGA
jgi:arylformamidase